MCIFCGSEYIDLSLQHIMHISLLDVKAKLKEKERDLKKNAMAQKFLYLTSFSKS